MKIYTKCVIDIKSGEILEEESYEYDGEVSLCGGSSGGGGGSSGKVDYPAYLKENHADLLGGGDPDGSGMSSVSAGNSLTELLDTSITNNPFDGLSAYDPSDEIAEFDSALSGFKDNINEYKNFIDNLESTDEIDVQLAKFDSGMRDINAVVSSSFAVGRQLVASGLVDRKIQARATVAELDKIYMNYQIEAGRMKIVAKKEETDINRKIDELQATWPFELFNYAANLMAGPAGGTVSKGGESPSTLQSALGGAASGAAAGAAITGGNPIGIGIGAAVGGLSGAM